MGDVFERLKAAGEGMGIRNSDDYLFSMTVTEAIIVQDRIEELEAALKATEAETPTPPSTDDPSARLSDETASDYVLQDDFLEHKQDTEQALKELTEQMRGLSYRVDATITLQERLERRMSEGSLDGVLQKLNGLATNTPSPPEPGSEDKTPDRQLGDVATNGEVWRPSRFPNQPTWLEERRSGKERRELLSAKTEDERRIAREKHLCHHRRKSARRKSDRQE